jgi:hypothetical protein
MAIDRQDANRRLIKLAEGPNIRFWRIDYDQLSFAERVFGLIWELESEVNNGGFHQYFWNSTGVLAPDVVDALHAVGAVRTWSDDDARKAAITSLSLAVREKLNELDQAFYASPDDLTELLYRYVDKHRAEIGAPENF